MKTTTLIIRLNKPFWQERRRRSAGVREGLAFDCAVRRAEIDGRPATEIRSGLTFAFFCRPLTRGQLLAHIAVIGQPAI